MGLPPIFPLACLVLGGPKEEKTPTGTLGLFRRVHIAETTSPRGGQEAVAQARQQPFRQQLLPEYLSVQGSDL